MKKYFIALAILISASLQAQFIEKKPPSAFDLELNNAKEFAAIYKLAAKAYAEKKHHDYLDAAKKLVELKPGNPDLQFKLAEAFALVNRKTEAFNTLIKIQKQGLYYDLSKSINFDNNNKYPVFEYIKNNMDTSANHYGEGKEVFSIDSTNSALLFESIEFDSANLSFLLGSVRDGSIIKIDDKGQASVLVPASKGGMDGPWAVFDMKTDAKNNVLWVASSSVSQYGNMNNENLGMAGLFKYELSSGKLLNKFILPKQKTPQLISSLHLANNGDIYFIESYNNLILKLENDSKDIKLVLSSPVYNSMRSITLDDKSEHLYFSDNDKGIVSINLSTSTFVPIENTDSLNLTGISELVYDEGSLIIIQNGINPQRVMRLELDPSQTKVASILPLESAHPLFDYPSVGTVAGNDFYYIANSQWQNANQLGGLQASKSWQKLSIIRTEKKYNVEGREEYNKEINKQKMKAKDAGF